MHSRLGRGLLKRVEIDYHHVDGLDAMLARRGHVRGIVADVQNAAMDFGMQRLDPAIHHFREAGKLGDVFHGNAGFTQQLGRASGRNQFDVEGGKFLGKIDQAGFVSNAQNCALDFRHDVFLGNGISRITK